MNANNAKTSSRKAEELEKLVADICEEVFTYQLPQSYLRYQRSVFEKKTLSQRLAKLRLLAAAFKEHKGAFLSERVKQRYIDQLLEEYELFEDHLSLISQAEEERIISENLRQAQSDLSQFKQFLNQITEEEKIRKKKQAFRRTWVYSPLILLYLPYLFGKWVVWPILKYTGIGLVGLFWLIAESLDSKSAPSSSSASNKPATQKPAEKKHTFVKTFACAYCGGNSSGNSCHESPDGHHKLLPAAPAYQCMYCGVKGDIPKYAGSCNTSPHKKHEWTPVCD